MIISGYIYTYIYIYIYIYIDRQTQTKQTIITKFDKFSVKLRFLPLLSLREEALKSELFPQETVT